MIFYLRRNEPGRQEVAIDQCWHQEELDKADTKKKKSNKAESSHLFS